MNHLLSTMANTMAIDTELSDTKSSFFSKIFKKICKPKQHNYYGAELEAYIIANNPKTINEIEELERRFDRKRKELNIYEHARWL